MKINLWSVGKGHETYIKSGIEDFTQRISRYYPVEWQLLSPPKNEVNDMKRKEGELNLKMVQREDYLVALDERGKQFSSEELAVFIQARANASCKRLVFLIGGAYGLDEAVLK